jgi:hypothetical protein
LASISPNELAVELLNHCLRGGAWPADVLDTLVEEAIDEDPAIAAPATRALFSVLIERLADLFEPRLCGVYARLFARVIERVRPEIGTAAALAARYDEVRAVRPPAFEPETVLVPSRVTLGADIAVTSLVLDAAKQRFPGARILFAAPAKSWELFEKDPRLTHLPLRYGRGALLRDRLAVFEELREAAAAPGTLVLDPDSRLTQLGLLPVCDARRHHLFESRGFGGESLDTLPALTARWLRQTLGAGEVVPYLHPRYHYEQSSTPLVTVSFGVGENPAKRVEDPFEEEVLRHLAGLEAQVMVDVGAPGSEEEERVEAALGTLGENAGRIGVHRGPFASFAALIASSSFYLGYDSAGQHVAAALGVPLLSIFQGMASARMAARWRPDSPGPVTVLHAGEFQDVQDLLGAVRRAIRP